MEYGLNKKMNIRISIVIVLYNELPPIYKDLPRDVEVIIIDNTPNRNLALTGRGLIYVPLYKNQGIAYALNRGFAIAIENKSTWVLTMDQDSILPKEMIPEYINFLKKKNDKIGIICPMLKLYDGQYKEPENLYSEINIALTSGSFINIEAYKESGGFKNELFIDWVDFEFCLNIRQRGYKIFKLNYILMQHHLGNTKEYKFLGKHLFYITNHNYIRCYYVKRNSMYVRSLYPNYYKTIEDSIFCRFRSIIKIILFETDVVRKLRAISLGKKDFKEKRMGEFLYSI